MNTIKLTSGREISYLNEVEIRIAMDDCNAMEKFAVELDGTEKSDITVHKYEGGFKIWECTLDLCDFIEEQGEEYFKGKRVLELGCGAAIPAILTAMNGAAHVFVQDFNESVIEYFAVPNFSVNEHKAEVGSSFGGWELVPEKVPEKGFDVILSSETIYNEDDYDVLHDAIAWSLADDGVAWFAAKFFYFGVGGSVPSFCASINKKGVFEAKEIKIIDASIPRRIIEIRRKKD